MGYNTITYTMDCVNGECTGTWSENHDEVNNHGKVIIKAGSGSGGASVWDLPSILSPSNNFTLDAGEEQSLNVNRSSGGDPSTEYSFNFSLNSCTCENEPPQFTVDG